MIFYSPNFLGIVLHHICILLPAPLDNTHLSRATLYGYLWLDFFSLQIVTLAKYAWTNIWTFKQEISNRFSIFSFGREPFQSKIWAHLLDQLRETLKLKHLIFQTNHLMLQTKTPNISFFVFHLSAGNIISATQSLTSKESPGTTCFIPTAWKKFRTNTD